MRGPDDNVTIRPKLIAAGLLTGLALAAVALALFFMLRILPDYQRETGATPTPTAAYGNMMAVTRDPSQPTPFPALSKGSRGERVLRLQTRLRELGYYAGETDGQFGGGTEQAVMLFQQANGLDADGYVGEATEAILYSDSAVRYTGTPVTSAAPTAAASTPVPFPGTLRSGSKGDSVITLQTRLRELGYYTGAIDGDYGRGTQNAVSAFQSANGLTADGVCGQLTWTALFSDTAAPKPTMAPVPTLDPSAARPYVRADGLPLVVNKKNPLPEGYATLQLVDMSTYCDPDIVKIKYAGTLAESEAVDALMVMLGAARAEGVGDWQISAAYRSEAYQQQLMDEKVAELMRVNGLSRTKAEKAALNTVAEPGKSEHHLGTCFDITVPGRTFSGTRQHQWLTENCWKYGFILRYAKDKESITGYTAEAWHYRWVGQPHAQIMHEENLCLEEYVAKYGQP